MLVAILGGFLRSYQSPAYWYFIGPKARVSPLVPWSASQINGGTHQLTQLIIKWVCPKKKGIIYHLRGMVDLFSYRDLQKLAGRIINDRVIPR